jgi:hypothetical protein
MKLAKLGGDSADPVGPGPIRIQSDNLHRLGVKRPLRQVRGRVSAIRFPLGRIGGMQPKIRQAATSPPPHVANG